MEVRGHLGVDLCILSAVSYASLPVGIFSVRIMRVCECVHSSLISPELLGVLCRWCLILSSLSLHPCPAKQKGRRDDLASPFPFRNARLPPHGQNASNLVLKFRFHFDWLLRLLY